jgi:hypothetical protein
LIESRNITVTAERGPIPRLAICGFALNSTFGFSAPASSSKSASETMCHTSARTTSGSRSLRAWILATSSLLRDARRALLIRLRSLGDAVLMTPVPTALKAWRPSLHVAILIEEPFAAVFRHHPAVDEVLCLPAGAALRERLQCAAALRRSGFELVFNMHSGSTAGLLTALSGATLRVAYARARFAAACQVRVASGAEREHTVLHQLRPLAELGIQVPRRPELELHVDPAARGALSRNSWPNAACAGASTS